MAFPSTVINVTAELALGADITASPTTWAWTDVTDYVMAGAGIRFARGGFGGQVQAPPGWCEFVALNTDGRWVPSNPSGAWYGQIGKGTPFRIVVDEGTPSVRWTGFLTELPPRWDPSENLKVVTVRAGGIFQRLERGSTPLRSPLFRAFSGTSTPPKSYWPAEDDSRATTLAEFSGGMPMTWTGSLTVGDDGPDGSGALPELTTFVGLNGNVTPHLATGVWSTAFVFLADAAPSADTVILRWKTNGSLPVWQLVLNPLGGGVDTVTLEAYDAGGTKQLSDATNFGGTTSDYGRWTLFQTVAKQNGTGVDYTMLQMADLGDGTAGGNSSTGTVASQTVGAVTSVIVPSTAKTNGMHMGHFAAWDMDIDPLGAGPISALALSGYAGSDAASRADQLAFEEGLIGAVFSASHVEMGPQEQDTFMNLMRGCEAASGGRLIEVMDPVGTSGLLVALLTNTDLENLSATMTLDHDQGQFAVDFAPTDDDQNLRNDWTATRTGATGPGSSARVVATSGNLTPEKVGTYADSVNVNVWRDDQLPDQASWRVGLGTVEGLRLPTVSVNLTRNPGLIPAWIACDIGSRITLTNPPAGMPPDDIDLLIEGWTEFIGPYTWYATMNCSPYAPWHVIRLASTSGDTNEFLGRLAEDESCALRAAATSSALSFTVDPNVTRWTTVADDFPLSITVKPAGAPGIGEKVTVSSIATTAGTFVAAGTQSNGDNSTRTPSLPAGIAAGDTLFIFAAIRSTTATVNDVTGYTRLSKVWPATSNVALFAKVATASESSPSVAFTGGAAGDTCSAVMIALRGTPTSLDDLNDMVVDFIPMFNASAQNIAYGGLYPYKVPGCIVVAFGWKQDDWTSVATLTGMTEAVDGPTTSGNDQGLVIDYVIQTTPALIPESSFVVTGGASAISRSAVVAFAAGYQTFTLSARGVNGVSMAQSAGARVAVYDPAVLAL